MSRLSFSEGVVLANGVFDLLHPGHLYLFQAAKELGTRLVVAIDSDSSVRSLNKKPRRPVNDQETRRQILAAIRWIDDVRIFNSQDDLIALIKDIRPEILVKGGDYQADMVIGKKEVESWGGRLVLIPYLEGKSTSNLIQRIQRL